MIITRRIPAPKLGCICSIALYDDPEIRRALGGVLIVFHNHVFRSYPGYIHEGSLVLMLRIPQQGPLRFSRGGRFIITRYKTSSDGAINKEIDTIVVDFPVYNTPE